MNKCFLIFLSGIAIFLLSGCSNRYDIEYSNKHIMDKKYNTARVECADGELNKKIEHKSNDHLKHLKLYGDDLVVRCEIVNFDEGNRALRYFVSCGAGKAQIKIKNTVFDGNTEIANFYIEHNMYGGIFGGDAKNIANDDVVGLKIPKKIAINFLNLSEEEYEERSSVARN